MFEVTLKSEVSPVDGKTFLFKIEICKKYQEGLGFASEVIKKFLHMISDDQNECYWYVTLSSHHDRTNREFILSKVIKHELFY